MGLIKKSKDLVNEAVKDISEYQKGLRKPIKTRYSHFNESCLGGIHSGMIITIGAISGAGKTHTLQQIENDMFNKELNPECDGYVLLRCNWEMAVSKLLLRKLKSRLKRPISEILSSEPQESDLEVFKNVCNEERTEQIYYLEHPMLPYEWYNEVKAFLEEHKDKKQILVTIDHIALVKSVGENKKKGIDDLVEYINTLRKEFKNVSFIIISQLNREIESRTDIRHLAPKRSDLYNSDTIYHISDLVLVIHNPFKLGHDKYMVVNGLYETNDGVITDSPYAKYAKYMDKPDSKHTNFLTKGLIFWHYIKKREDEGHLDMAIEEMHFYKTNQTASEERQKREMIREVSQELSENQVLSKHAKTYDDNPFIDSHTYHIKNNLKHSDSFLAEDDDEVPF